MRYLVFFLYIILFISYSHNTIVKALSLDPDTRYATTDDNSINSLEAPETAISQAQSDTPGQIKSGIKSVSVSISYNPDKSDIVTSDLLDNIRREISTTFIGSGYRYSTEDSADISVKAFLELEVSSYEQQNKKIYDIVSKIDLQSYDQQNKLLKETSKSIFLSGDQLNDVILDASRRSSNMATRDLVDELDTLYDNNNPKEVTTISLKIEIIFRGSNNYRYFNDLNKLLMESPYNLQLIKRTFDPGNFFSVIVASHVESNILSNYIRQNLKGSDSLQLSDIQQNRIVFYIVPGTN